MAPIKNAVVPPLAKPGQVIILKFPEQLHAYMEEHALEPLAWRGNVLVLQKVVERRLEDYVNPDEKSEVS